MQAYSDPTREADPHALPDVEVFHAIDYADGDLELSDGYYWWICFPGCLPNRGPTGPFDTAELALTDAQMTAEHDL